MLRSKPLMCLFFLSTLAGCDILSPPAREPGDLLEYVSFVRERTQMLSRWLPVVTEQDQFQGPAYGMFPVTTPVTFAGPVSRIEDFAGQTTTPSSYQCSPTCEAIWAGEYRFGQYFQMITINPDNGTISGAWADVTTPTWGRFRVIQTEAGSQSRLDTVKITPIRTWTYACDGTTPVADCGIDASWWRGIQANGIISAGDRTAQFELDVADWASGFPWAGRPRLARYAAGPERARTVYYGNGATYDARSGNRSGNWHVSAPGVTQSTGAVRFGGASLELNYRPDQSLFRIQTDIVFTDSGRTTAVTELRIPRFGRTIDAQVKITRNGDISTLRWSEPDLSGTLTLRKDALGWHLNGFWDSAFGDLVTIEGFYYGPGFWQGSFAGWQVTDIDLPTETGDWLMLADGSFQSTVLFKQVDGSLTEIPVYSPPEGAAPGIME